MNLKNIFPHINPADIESGDENRKRGMLYIFLAGISSIAVIILLISIIFREQAEEGAAFLYYAVPILLVLCGLIYLISRKNVQLASTLFIILLLVAITFSDTPEQVLEGRSLFFYIAPVMIASFIIGPSFSFHAAVLGSILLFWLAYSTELPMNYIGATGFFVFAFVGWLASSAYENTLKELKIINAELDQRVEARTHELAEANERLKDLDKLKTLFVSNVSHELRTPISNISMYLEMLQHGNPEKREDYIGVLQNETNRLTTLVKDTLDLSRLELGTMKMNLSQININEICEHVIATNKLRAEEKDLNMIITLQPDLAAIYGDGEKLTQVVQNLVTNAINYTPFGNVWLTTSSVDKDGQQFASIEVKDTGMGISEEDLKQLFEPFFRGEKLNQSAIPGTGLGLAISKEIVEYHQGEITIESKLGEGSIFTILLPITPPLK